MNVRLMCLVLGLVLVGLSAGFIAFGGLEDDGSGPEGAAPVPPSDHLQPPAIPGDIPEADLLEAPDIESEDNISPMFADGDVSPPALPEL